MFLCSTKQRRPVPQTGGFCGMGRQLRPERAMSGDAAEDMARRTEARSNPGAAGAAALRAMLIPEQEEPLTPTFDRNADRLVDSQPPLAGHLPKAKDGAPCNNGSGRQVWPDGATYEGRYKNGLKHGMGRFMWASGATYEGEFEEDRLQGSGSFKWPCGSTYQGAWKNGRMHGSGLFTWPDGRSYEGSYHNDFKDGQGVFRWPDGRQYDGHFKDGVQHGSGMFTSAKGKSKRTEWVAGQLVQSHTRLGGA